MKKFIDGLADSINTAKCSIKAQFNKLGLTAKQRDAYDELSSKLHIDPNFRKQDIAVPAHIAAEDAQKALYILKLERPHQDFLVRWEGKGGQTSSLSLKKMKF